MARYIDADKIRRQLLEDHLKAPKRIKQIIIETIIKAIDIAPTADVIEQRHGLWIYNTDDFTPALRCSVCGYNKPEIAGEKLRREPENYCANCGAKMEKR